MEAQTGKLFRPGDEVVHVVEAVEQRAGERALMSWGSVAYSVCTLIVFGYCIRMTQKMSQDKDPFNAENVALLLRFLADVFEYGVELQQLSDETLDWLAGINRLSPEEQMAISCCPADLIEVLELDEEDAPAED